MEEDNRFRGPDSSVPQKRRLSVRLIRELGVFLDRWENSSVRDSGVLMKCSSGGHLSSSWASKLRV